MIGGAVIDSAHSDECPVFYGFNATNNKFINNVGRAKYDSTLMSLGLAFKLWNEAVNVTLHNNVFINNINAVHGAAYCIIGTNVTITNNYVEANRLFTVQVLKLIMVTLLLKIQYLLTMLLQVTIHNILIGMEVVQLLHSWEVIIIYNCTFTNNTAYGHAGAIDIVGGIKKDANGTEYYLIANNTVIKDSNFFDNIAFDYAGAVHINGTNTMMDNTTFEHNNASFAGGVRLIGENVTIVNSTFNDNNAIQGGACYVEGENANILDSIFNFNNATHNNY